METREVSPSAYYGAIFAMVLLGAVFGSIIVLSLTTWWKSSQQLPDTGTAYDTSTQDCSGDYPSCPITCDTRLDQVYMFANLTPTSTAFATFDPNSSVLYLTDDVRFFNFGVLVDETTGVFDFPGNGGSLPAVRGTVNVLVSPPEISFEEPSGLVMPFTDLTDPNSSLWSLGLPVVKYENCTPGSADVVFADTSPDHADTIARCLSNFGFVGTIAATSVDHGEKSTICTFVINLEAKRAVLIFQKDSGIGPGSRGPQSPNLDLLFGPVDDTLSFNWGGCSNGFGDPVRGFVDPVMGLIHLQYRERRIGLGLLSADELNFRNLFSNSG